MDNARASARTRRWVVAVGLAVAGGLSGHAILANPSQDSPVWVAHSRGASAVDGSDGQTLIELAVQTGARGIAIDASREIVWILSQHALVANSPEGVPLFSVELPSPRGEPSFLYVDDDTGTVWVAVQSQVLAFGPGGTLLVQHRLPKPLTGATFDTARSLFWYAHENIIEAIDASGGVVSRVEFDRVKRIRAIAYAAESDRIWITTDDGLSQVTGDGSSHLALAQGRFYSDLVALAANGFGGVWASDGQLLYQLDSTGAVLYTVRPFEGDSPEHIRALVADRTDGSVWVASHRIVAHILPGGELRLKAVPDPGDGKARNLAGLAIAGGAAGPRIEIISPEDGALLNESRPTFHLAYSGTDLDLASIAFTVDDASLIVSCTVEQVVAECITETLADGEHTIAATIATRNGIQSTPATLSLTVDTQTPVVTVDQPAPGFLTNDPSMSISGRVDETATVRINEQLAQVSGLNFTHGPVTLEEGANTFEVRATDLAGNSSTRIVSGTLDSIPPPAPVQAMIQTVGAGGQATVSGSTGSVEAGATVAVTNTRTGEVVTAIADASGVFTAIIAANPDDQLTITATDAAGNQGQVTAVTVPEDGGDYIDNRFDGPISILGTSPASGAIVEGDYILVAVDVQAPPNTGVIIGPEIGLPVRVPDGLRYYARLQLQPGLNDIEIVVRGQDGRLVEQIISITSTASFPYFIAVHPETGASPLEVEFRVQDQAGIGILDMEVDFTTDGIVDMITDGAEPIIHRYSGIGSRSGEFWIFDDSGRGHVQDVPILLMNPEIVDASIQEIWDAMNDALVAGERNLALSYLTDGAREQYGEIFSILLERMPEIVGSYSSLRQSYVADGYVEYGVNRTVNGVNRLFLVSFIRNGYGQWQLDSM